MPAWSSAMTGSSNQVRSQSATRRAKRRASADGVGAVGVDHQRHVRPERRPRRPDPRRRDVRRAVHRADPHLDGAEAARGDVAPELLADAARRPPSRRRRRPAAGRPCARRAGARPAAPSDLPRMSQSAMSTALIAATRQPAAGELGHRVAFGERGLVRARRCRASPRSSRCRPGRGRSAAARTRRSADAPARRSCRRCRRRSCPRPSRRCRRRSRSAGSPRRRWSAARNR